MFIHFLSITIDPCHPQPQTSKRDGVALSRGPNPQRSCQETPPRKSSAQSPAECKPAQTSAKRCKKRVMFTASKWHFPTGFPEPDVGKRETKNWLDFSERFISEAWWFNMLGLSLVPCWQSFCCSTTCRKRCDHSKRSYWCSSPSENWRINGLKRLKWISTGGKWWKFYRGPLQMVDDHWWLHVVRKYLQYPAVEVRGNIHTATYIHLDLGLLRSVGTIISTYLNYYPTVLMKTSRIEYWN